ncbi:Two component system response regulator, sigma factor 54 interaction domain-containing [Desulfonema limicola]|uniref:Two component system response regulator, sigma factor 54 interaction domain-containing n=1 Tax=Desulfonema limicola TaxID=45656 RepID=A0A975BB52_9BACT|nr:sigma-54 dependent transcriptional regulator [Desulfonema limicola]QTA82193.1 Two component system response regulator, sigma factor 54 interaction domain-containing [Desulfonema limicola]
MNILIVDDEKMQRDMLKGFLVKQGYEVTSAENGQNAMDLFLQQPFQLVILDHKMPDMNGDELFAKIKEINPLIHAIMITAYGSVDTAVEVMKMGADDFMEKPVDLLQVLDKIRMIEQRIITQKEADDVAEIIENQALPIKIAGNSQAVKDVLSLVQRLAPTPWAVLIRGETGTGKELIARLVHLLSNVNEGPFIEINCGAVPENLFESELFGHEKGAFTGAASARKGRFELADNGTIFLDEIGELPLNLQPKLLRAIQEKRISRVGSEKDIDINVRIVAATNRELRLMAEQGLFREDLFFRLNVFEIEIPPLRDRKEDIPILVDFFLDRFSPRKVSFDPDAMSTLMKYTFPGNVRELEHIIQRTITLVRGSVITSRDLPLEIRYHQVSQQGTLSQRLEALEKELIISALEKYEWVQTKAADSLGISERVLRYKMKKNKIKNLSAVLWKL